MRLTEPLSFVLGAAVGFLAGTSAARRQYAQLRDAADTFVHDPALRDRATKATSAATSAGTATVAKAKDVAGNVTTAVKSKIGASQNGSDSSIDITESSDTTV
ncbi:MAG TPA: hypothetical protein VMI11_14095 [Actinomycetes bacterium]|nr:hypothetical protein [Actinomycetes bacterium]